MLLLGTGSYLVACYGIVDLVGDRVQRPGRGLVSLVDAQRDEAEGGAPTTTTQVLLGQGCRPGSLRAANFRAASGSQETKRGNTTDGLDTRTAQKPKEEIPLMGLEPTIFGLGGQRVIHCATSAKASLQSGICAIKIYFLHIFVCVAEAASPVQKYELDIYRNL